MTMKNGSSELTLMVHVAADEWAYARRRLTYLEAVLRQLLQEEDVREWYDAAELSELQLLGLPTSKSAITRLARDGGWLRREISGRGGVRYEYHYASFPTRAFDDMVGRILGMRSPLDEVPDQAPVVPAPPPQAALNTEPPWVLPFMRLLRGGANGDITAAWRALPQHVPAGVPLPTAEEAAETILRLGLAR